MPGLVDLRTPRLVSTSNVKAALSGALVGCILAFFIKVSFIVLVPLSAVSSILINWLISDMHSRDEKQGLGEFSEMEASLDKLIEKAVDAIPEASNGLSFKGSRVYDALLRRAGEHEPGHGKFVLNMAAASVASWEGWDDKAIHALGFALDARPDMVAHFRKAEALEHLGFGERAILAYEEALRSTSNPSNALKAFIASQVKRVRVHGPKSRPATSGLRHALYW